MELMTLPLMTMQLHIHTRFYLFTSYIHKYFIQTLTHTSNFTRHDIKKPLTKCTNYKHRFGKEKKNSETMNLDQNGNNLKTET